MVWQSLHAVACELTGVLDAVQGTAGMHSLRLGCGSMGRPEPAPREGFGCIAEAGQSEVCLLSQHWGFAATSDGRL